MAIKIKKRPKKESPRTPPVGSFLGISPTPLDWRKISISWGVGYFSHSDPRPTERALGPAPAGPAGVPKPAKHMKIVCFFHFFHNELGT